MLPLNATNVAVPLMTADLQSVGVRPSGTFCGGVGDGVNMTAAPFH